MTVLCPVGSRFPLTRGRGRSAAVAEEVADGSADALRPFGLRFFTPQPAPCAEPAFGYSEDQQVTVDVGGRPVVEGPDASWSQTSTGNMDGNEETKMDQDPDSN